jgi:hypothetical protein
MVVADLLPVGGLGAFVGMPGEGKTLLGVELARCIAAGATFGGRQCMRGGVVYACPDAPLSTERRLLGILDKVARKIATIIDSPALPCGLARFRKAVRRGAKLLGRRIRLVILDKRGRRAGLVDSTGTGCHPWEL